MLNFINGAQPVIDPEFRSRNLSVQNISSRKISLYSREHFVSKVIIKPHFCIHIVKGVPSPRCY